MLQVNVGCCVVYVALLPHALSLVSECLLDLIRSSPIRSRHQALSSIRWILYLATLLIFPSSRQDRTLSVSPSIPPNIFSTSTMASNDENAQPDDLEEQQRLAQDYQPDVLGPFVGPPRHLEVLLEEFEPSDPRCIKIKNLAKEYPYIRRMKGDGSCGYRALLFGFLVNLCQHAIDGGPDPLEFSKVIDRHVQAMKDRGFDEMIFEDWVATMRETLGALSKTLARDTHIHNQYAPHAHLAIDLEQAFNDEEKNSELIQYARMATSSWLIQVDSKSVVSLDFLIECSGCLSLYRFYSTHEYW